MVVGFRARQIAALTLTAATVALATGLISAVTLVRTQVLDARDRGELWAKTFYSGSKPMQLFAATTEAQTAPTVSFDQPAAPAAPAPAP